MKKPGAGTMTGTRVRESLAVAADQGLLQGPRSHVVRGRMPAALVARAKARTGIRSDTELVVAALAQLAVCDDYADWLLSRQGAVAGDIDLEF